MAIGSESGDRLVSSIRIGNKREFAYAMQQQIEYAQFLGRKRITRSQTTPSNNSTPKRVNRNVKDNKVSNKVAKKSSIGDEQIGHAQNLVNDEALVDLDEKQGVAMDFMENTVLEIEIDRDNGMKIDAGINLGGTMVEVEGLKDDVVELGPMSEDLPKEDDQIRQINSETFLINDNVEEIHLQTPFKEFGIAFESTRRITRSALKLKEAISEVLGINDVKAEQVVESCVVDSSAVKPLPAKKMEMKMSKKVELKRCPTKVKDLLDTGLLEGLPVQYIRGAKVRGPSEARLQGVIKGSGILCFCDFCNGTEVVTPNLFELHAGSGNKRPPEYIFLENGNSLRDVLNACKNAPPDSLELVIQMAIGCLSGRKPIFCLNCKGSISEDGAGKTMLLCDSCMVKKESQSCSAQMSDGSDRSPMSASIPKSSDPQPYCGSSRSKGQGRITRKDLRMHKLVFEEDGLPDGTALTYYAGGQKLLEGYKKGFGIFCFCCNNEVSPSQFEAHAGRASRRKPFHNIYTSNGVSLHEYSVSLSKDRKFSPDENDDLCSICADGGDLLCCDTCPRAFHTECVSLPSIPEGKWYCKYCQNMFQREKAVEHNANAVAAGRVAGIDALEQLTKRCIRIVETFEADVGGCMLCRGHDFSKSGFGPRTVIICDQCEKEYHVGCLKEHKMDDLKELPTGKWFCCTDCNRIHSALQKLVADGEEKLPNSLLGVIKKKYQEKGSEGTVDFDIRWRLLCGKMAYDYSRPLLSKAVAIFHDQFDPIADSTTSSLDLIPNMVYGRNMKGQEFGGMYCAVLTVNSSVVSAGIFRIFGSEVAELPLVATSSDCQGQGYFQSLFFCIENLLESLNVRSLVLPAADEAESIWTKKFGFEKIPEDQLKQYRRDYQMMVFQGTSMLHKSVSRS